MILLKEHMFNIMNMKTDELEKYMIIKAMKRVLYFPNKAFSVRGLAREMGISVGSAKSALDFMAGTKIVKLSVVGRTYQYRADLESVLCRQWKVVFNLEEIRNSGIMHIPENENVFSVLLYGSFAKGTNDEKSDVDVLYVAHKMPKERAGAPRFEREVNVSWITLDNWKKKAREDKVFYESVIYDSIVLYGQRPVVV